MAGMAQTFADALQRTEETRDPEHLVRLFADGAELRNLAISEQGIEGARRFASGDPAIAALLAYLRPLVAGAGRPAQHRHEEAREAGWSDEQILETVAHVALATFGNLVTRAGDVPVDGSSEESRLMQAA